MAETDRKIAADGVEPGEEEWRLVAWRMWLHGVRNYSAISRAVGKDRETVKRAVSEVSKSVAASLLSGEVDALSEYVDGLYEDLQEADRFVREADTSNAQVGAL